MTAKHDQLVIVQKYETFLAYVYPIAQNLPRKHGVAKEMFLRDMLGQVELFIVAAKSGQISRIREADAGLTMLRFWLDEQHHVADQLAAQRKRRKPTRDQLLEDLFE